MAATPSIKITNGYAIKNPNDPDYNANKQVDHYIRKKWVMVHSVTKSTPKAFHSTASFYSQFYKTILPFFYDKAEMQKQGVWNHP